MTRSDGVASAGSRELAGLSTGALREFRDRERARYAAIKARATPYNLARGKPATDQVALADQLLTAVSTPEQCWAEDGNDCRNYYGSPQGLIEARRRMMRIRGAARGERRSGGEYFDHIQDSPTSHTLASWVPGAISRSPYAPHRRLRRAGPSAI